MINIKDLSKKFKNTVVVDSITVHFARGNIYGIVGRNGSGKTILFKMISGLLSPSSGEIFVDGRKIGTDEDFPKETGIIIENPAFLPWQNAMDALMDLARLNHRIGREEVRESIIKVGLNPDSRKKIGKYSLGMKQRLALAQAIMERPKLLILDEPMNGLDRQGVEDIRGLLLELKKEGCTILIASHNREDIDVLCDQVYEMDAGKWSLLRGDVGLP